MNKIPVILNPAARSDRAGAMRERIEALSIRCAVRMTSRPGEAREIAAAAAASGSKIVVAAGGDGTVNEVAAGLAGTDTALGILPVGTMNVFASELSIPTNLPAAWQVIEAGHVRELDFPEANGQPFVQLAGVGLDAEVVRRTDLEAKRALGPLSYLISLAQVAAGPAPRIEILLRDSHPRSGGFVLVGNGRLYGGPFTLFRDARLDDGLLDVLVFQSQSHWDLVRYTQAIAFGNHPSLPDVEYFQTSGMTLRSPVEVPVELDGELTGVLPCEFGFSSHKIRVLAP